MATNNLSLTQPAYLSDGETAVDAINANMTIIDNLISTSTLVHDGNLVTYNSEILITLL